MYKIGWVKYWFWWVMYKLDPMRVGKVQENSP